MVDVLQQTSSIFSRSIKITGGTRGIMFSVPENGPSDSRSNPGRDCLHFT